MLPSKLLFFSWKPKQDNAKLYTAFITKAWFWSRRNRVLVGLACSPNFWPAENIWPITKCKIWQRRPSYVEQLESYICQEWGSIPLSKVQQLVSSVPKELLDCCWKKRGCYTAVLNHVLLIVHGHQFLICAEEGFSTVLFLHSETFHTDPIKRPERCFNMFSER